MDGKAYQGYNPAVLSDALGLQGKTKEVSSTTDIYRRMDRVLVAWVQAVGQIPPKWRLYKAAESGYSLRNFAHCIGHLKVTMRARDSGTWDPKYHFGNNGWRKMRDFQHLASFADRVRVRFQRWSSTLTSEEVRKRGVSDPFEETTVTTSRPISLSPVSDEELPNRADRQALEFYMSFDGMSSSRATDERLWAWMTHFRLHAYSLSRWRRPSNVNLRNYIRSHWFSSGSTDAFWRHNTASRTWWIAYTAIKARAGFCGRIYRPSKHLEHLPTQPSSTTFPCTTTSRENP